MRIPRRRYWGLLLIALVLSIAFSIIYFREQIMELEEYGYLGGFFIGMLSSGTIFVPIPGILLTFTLGGILKYPWLLGIIVGLGETIGELTGYGIGRGGRLLLIDNPRPIYLRLVSWMRRRGGLMIFLTAAIPNPIFDLIGAAAGILGYPLWRFLLICWMGKAIKATGIALAGYWGLKFVLNWLEMLKIL